MIFVTVGTHEQPFDRLIKKVDYLVGENIINEEVFIQTGFSTYKPLYCKNSKLISYNEMQEKIKKARIVITHGGPSSFFNVLQYNKVPIVVPRREKFGEHVNDHQLQFLNEVTKKGYKLIKVENIEDLEKRINEYNESNIEFQSNNDSFNSAFSKIVNGLFD